MFIEELVPFPTAVVHDGDYGARHAILALRERL